MSTNTLNPMANVVAGHTSAASTASAINKAARERTENMSNQFLKLLVTQMQNQDPLNPMDNAQVTSQIAQINTVSGINDLNNQLAKINGKIDTSQQLQASKLIGHEVLVPGNKIRVGDKGAATPFGVDLPANAAKVKITITDDAGTVVHQSTQSHLKAGVQSFSWDGKDANSKPVDAGSYTVNIQAEDADGKSIKAKPLATGYVDGVVSAGSSDSSASSGAADSGPRLDLGPSGLVPLRDVYQIL
jgi:flagellar basal-body rod modification protein FlgD